MVLRSVLKIRYLLLGGAVGGGASLAKQYEEWKKGVYCVVYSLLGIRIRHILSGGSGSFGHGFVFKGLSKTEMIFFTYLGDHPFLYKNKKF